jgi:hypothetical protein
MSAARAATAVSRAISRAKPISVRVALLNGSFGRPQWGHIPRLFGISRSQVEQAIMRASEGFPVWPIGKGPTNAGPWQPPRCQERRAGAPTLNSAFGRETNADHGGPFRSFDFPVSSHPIRRASAISAAVASGNCSVMRLRVTLKDHPSGTASTQMRSISLRRASGGGSFRPISSPPLLVQLRLGHRTQGPHRLGRSVSPPTHQNKDEAPFRSGRVLTSHQKDDCSWS